MISVGNMIIGLPWPGWKSSGFTLYTYNGPAFAAGVLRRIADDEIMLVVGITMTRPDGSPFILNVLTSAGDSGHIFVREGIYKVIS